MAVAARIVSVTKYGIFPRYLVRISSDPIRFDRDCYLHLPLHSLALAVCKFANWSKLNHLMNWLRYQTNCCSSSDRLWNRYEAAQRRRSALGHWVCPIFCAFHQRSKGKFRLLQESNAMSIKRRAGGGLTHHYHPPVNVVVITAAYIPPPPIDN